MTAISKNVYFDVLNDIVDEHNNAYHKTIKMKPIDVKNGSFAEYKSSGKNIKVELDLSSYATKTDLKCVTHVDVSSFAPKTNLANLKIKVDKIYVDKLTPVPDNLVKLSKAVKTDVVKKTECNKLVTKVDDIDTTGFVLKTKYDTDKSGLEKKISDVDKKIPDTSSLVKKQITVLRLLK